MDDTASRRDDRVRCCAVVLANAARGEALRKKFGIFCARCSERICSPNWSPAGDSAARHFQKVPLNWWAVEDSNL